MAARARRWCMSRLWKNFPSWISYTSCEPLKRLRGGLGKNREEETTRTKTTTTTIGRREVGRKRALKDKCRRCRARVTCMTLWKTSKEPALHHVRLQHAHVKRSSAAHITRRERTPQSAYVTCSRHKTKCISCYAICVYLCPSKLSKRSRQKPPVAEVRSGCDSCEAGRLPSTPGVCAFVFLFVESTDLCRAAAKARSCFSVSANSLARISSLSTWSFNRAISASASPGTAAAA
eukprot:3932829-Rhodomonas_salina.1